VTAAEDIVALSLDGTRAAVRDRELTALEVTEAALAQAERFDGSHRLFISRDDDAARTAAADLDAATAAGRIVGPLHGVPITVKDNIDVAGFATTAGSLVLRDRRPAVDATAVARLRAAGAVIVGKTNMHEMAMGTTSDNPHYGAVRNPWDPTHIPGGSSGGSAAAVALRVGSASIGTDGGGSVRIPSACCGLVGLKPTHGVVPLTGLVASGSQHVDTIGPHTRTVADARLLLTVLTGPDEHDVHSASRPCAEATPLSDLRGLTVGLPQTPFWTGLDPEVEACARRVVELMAACGASVVPVETRMGELLPLLRVLKSAESYVLHAPMLQEHPELYSPELRHRLLAGQYVLAQDYIRAMRVRRLVVEEMRTAIADADVLAMPTVPIPPFPIADSTDWVENGGRLGRNTSPVNLSGHPAVTVPVGLTDGGLPLGFQLVGRAFDDHRLLAVAEVVERAVGFDPTPPVLAGERGRAARATRQSPSDGAASQNLGDRLGA